MQSLSKSFRDETQGLAGLAEQIRVEHAAVIQAANDVLGHVLTVGRALIIAQKSVPKGQWADWVERSCEVSYRTARRYIQLARAYDAGGHGVTKDLAGLSLRGLMRAFTPSKDLNTSQERRRSSPAPQDKLNPLAWANASPTQRARFISAIGWQALAEAIPANWRPIIERWLQARLIVIERGGDPSPPDDLGIPSFLNRAQTSSPATDAGRSPNLSGIMRSECHE
jgi:Protein of unknown function (DUF3102)